MSQDSYLISSLRESLKDVEASDLPSDVKRPIKSIILAIIENVNKDKETKQDQEKAFDDLYNTIDEDIKKVKDHNSSGGLKFWGSIAGSLGFACLMIWKVFILSITEEMKGTYVPQIPYLSQIESSHTITEEYRIRDFKLLQELKKTIKDVEAKYDLRKTASDAESSEFRMIHLNMWSAISKLEKSLQKKDR